MSGRERLRLLLQGGLAVKLAGWRRWAYITASFYFSLWLIAALFGLAPHGAAGIASLVIMVIAAVVLVAIFIGPAAIAAPVVSRDEQGDRGGNDPENPAA